MGPVPGKTEVLSYVCELYCIINIRVKYLNFPRVPRLWILPSGMF